MKKFSILPAIFIEGENVAFVFNASHTVGISMPRGEYLIVCVILGTTMLGMLRPVVPQ